MSAKKSFDFKSAFDDRSLPVNDLSVKRVEEIEKILMPELMDRIEKLKKEKSHLFKSLKK